MSWTRGRTWDPWRSLISRQARVIAGLAALAR
jgi:hypothetical protein